MMKLSSFAAALAALPLATMHGTDAAALAVFDHAPPPGVVKPTAPAAREVGAAYSTWLFANQWDLTKEWGTPQLGPYKSDNRAVIRQHAAWLAGAGVDFIWIDWSNDIGYTYNPAAPRADFDMIEGATFAVFDEFTKLRAAGLPTPRISLFIGTPGEEATAVDNGHLQRKADQVWNQFAANPNYRPLLENYLGKPLLVVYLNTPTLYQNATPKWSDPRFTVRYMTGFLAQQPNLVTPELVSRHGYWSWEDRGPQTYPVVNGYPEAMTVVAAWRNDPTCPTPGRAGGLTFRREWERARQIGPRFAMVVSWNEWSKGEQPSAEISKDIEPSKEFGTKYLDILKEEIALFKAGK